MIRKIFGLFVFFALILLAVPVGAQSNDCPDGQIAIAKAHPSDYDGQDFESTFEYGAEFIDIGRFLYNSSSEVIELDWFVQPDNDLWPISAACVKAGQSLDCTEYIPAKVPQTPIPEVITVSALGQNAISHVTWCAFDSPTAIGVLSPLVQTNDVGATAGLVAAVLFAAVFIILYRNRR